MKQIKAAIVLILMIFFLTSVLNNSVSPQRTELNDSPNPIVIIKTDSPIQINGNKNFTDYGFPGNGSVGNPYRIENYIINLSGVNTHGISIENTDATFLIENCTITNMPVGYDGIWLSNVTNALLKENNLEVGELNGIKLDNSDENLLINNSISIIFNGIVLSSSHHNILINNSVLDGLFSGDGIKISNARNNTLFKNKIKRYSTGIEISNAGSYNNSIFNNSISENSKGIGLGANENEIINNTFTDNYFYGMTIGGINNQISSNKFRNNGIFITAELVNEITPDNLIDSRPIYFFIHKNGISVPKNASQVILINCSSMTVFDINASAASMGIILSSCKNITVSNNTANANQNGIYSTSSYNLTLNYNKLSSNSKGILFNNTNYSSILNNIIYKGGIALGGSYNNRIINNTSNNHTLSSGISLGGESSNVQIINNTCNYNKRGIHLVYAGVNNTIEKNNLNSNTYGIMFDHSPFNSVTNCTITVKGLGSSTEAYGIYLEVSNNISISNISTKRQLFSGWSGWTYGIYLESSNNCSISGITSNRLGYGLFLELSNYTKIIYNDLNDGIKLLTSTNNLIKNNSLINLVRFYGIFLQTSSNNNTILNNTVKHFDRGIYLHTSHSNTVLNNTVNHNREGFLIYAAKNNTISNNSINFNDEYGIVMHLSHNNTITQNELYHNLGCFYEGSTNTNNKIENNTCINRPDETPEIPGFKLWLVCIAIFIFYVVEQLNKDKSGRNLNHFFNINHSTRLIQHFNNIDERKYRSRPCGVCSALRPAIFK